MPPQLPLLLPGSSPNAFAPGGALWSPALPGVVTRVPPVLSAGDQLFYSTTAAQTTVVQDMGTTILTASITGWPTQFPAKMLLEWGTASQEVVILTCAPSLVPAGTSNAGAYNWTGVLRGQDGTTQVLHAAGAQVNHGVSAQDFYQGAPVFNPCAFGADPTGTADSSPAIAATLSAVAAAGGGVVDFGDFSNVFTVSQTIQVPSNTVLQGYATIRCCAGFNPVQVGTGSAQYLCTGAMLLATLGNTGQSNIIVRNLTLDGNQTRIPNVPPWANASESSACGLWNATNVLIDHVTVINSIGYSIYPSNVVNLTISNCRVLSGQLPFNLAGYVVQDGIHVSAFAGGKGTGVTQGVVITGNFIDTGTSGMGDDGIALQSYATISRVTISGNVVRSAEAGIALYLSAANTVVSDVSITGNIVWQTLGPSVNIDLDVPSAPGGLISNVSIAGNTFDGIALLPGYVAANIGAVSFPNSQGNAYSWWQNVSITGNTFKTFGTSGNMFGIFAQWGSYLTISGNTFPSFPGINGNGCIQLGGTGNAPVTYFTVTGNQVTYTTTGGAGIVLNDCSYGTVTDNTCTGSLGAGSSGMWIDSISLAPVSVNVIGNNFSGFVNSIQEFNGSGTAPDYNVIALNNCHGCTIPGVVVLGAHTTVNGHKFIQATAATAGTTGTGSQNVTGLVASLDAGTYYLEIVIPWTPTGTIGSHTNWGFAAGSGLTLSAISMASLILPTATTAAAGTSALVTSTTLSNAMWTGPTVSTTAGAGEARFWGTVTVNAAGTLQVIFANATSADTVTTGAGASMLIRPMT